MSSLQRFIPRCVPWSSTSWTLCNMSRDKISPKVKKVSVYTRGDVTATYPWDMFPQHFHVRVQTLWFLSPLHISATCCLSVHHIKFFTLQERVATCRCNTAGTCCYLSLQHVPATCPCNMSLQHVPAAYSCNLSLQHDLPCLATCTLFLFHEWSFFI